MCDVIYPFGCYLEVKGQQILIQKMGNKTGRCYTTSMHGARSLTNICVLLSCTGFVLTC